LEKRTAALVGESIAHAAHDTWFGLAPVLLASMSTELALKNSDIGLALLFYNAVSSVTQPFFGRLSEKVGGRVLAVSAIIWTSIMFMAAVYAPAKWVLLLVLALAGFGSGAFHPQGTANATASGGGRWGATAASVFFLGGTLGASLTGSALGGFLIGTFGRRSLVIIAFSAVSVALLVVRRLVPHELPDREDGPAPVEHSLPRQGAAFYVPLAVLLIGLALRALTQNTISSYVPKYEQDLGGSPATYGLVLSAFLAFNALGGVLGSYLADRIGFRGVLVASLAISGAALYGYFALPGLWRYVALVVSGLAFGPSHTLYLVSGQRRFPGRMATVAGLMLGFTFVSGSGGAWIMGLIGDSVGLRAVLGALPAILIASSVCAALSVPSRRQAPAMEPATAE
jgi:FSR family fosmidomycin resistance protein-like MFS transporter